MITLVFSHLVANGRRRKKLIHSIEHDGGVVTDRKQIRGVLVGYYKNLFRKQPFGTLRSGEEVWANSGRLSAEDNIILSKPFSEEEVRNVVFNMKENTASGLDGFSVTFYKNFWEVIKGDLLAMVNDFYLGNLDIARLNYGVIKLVPKVKEANNVKQYRPNCLLNTNFKIFTKLIMERLTGYVGKLISTSQTTFIKGRYIVDGAVILHEVMHELRVKKAKRVIYL
jgi:hypothetical protein